MELYDFSYDPHDPLYDAPNLPGVHFGVQLFTLQNMYGLDPAKVQCHALDNGLRLECSGLSWGGQQQRAEGRVEVLARWQGDVLTWQVQAWHAEPIKSIKLMLWGLPDEALRHGWWSPTTEQGTTVQSSLWQPLRWVYPVAGQWVTPWACAGGDGSAICVSFRDAQVREKRLYVYPASYAGSQTVVELICDEDARHFDGDFTTPEMRLHICHSQAEVDADFADHFRFVEQAYNLRPWDNRPDVKPWLQDVRLVINLHGQHWTGYVFNTFDRMAETIRFVAQHIEPRYIAAYLPGWEGRYYHAYPNFKPGEAMGGDAGFRRLVAVAKELGVRLMPMFGAHGANVANYPDWERAIFRNRTDRYAKLLNYPDWDGDRSAEDDQIFLNPGEPNFRKHLVEQVSRTVSAYDLEIIYLDTTATWFNDPRYHLYEGYLALSAELRERHPNLTLAGEGWTDALLALFPMNLSWMGVTRRFRYPEMLARYGRALQHLSEGAPGLGSTGVFEGGYMPVERKPVTTGHIPTISFVDDTLTKYSDKVIRICREIRQS